MTTTTPNPADALQQIVLDGISWTTYQNLLFDLDERPIRLTYDNGSLEIMPPLAIHEWWKRRLGLMIDLIAIGRQIHVEALGSTTFSREDLAKGLEPDECYYVAHVPSLTSAAFPFLPMKEFEGFLLRSGREMQLPVIDDFQVWLRSL